MTTKTLSKYVAAGYTLARRFDELIITSTGGVGGTGVYSNHFATISNAGTINATQSAAISVLLTMGGVVTNLDTGYIGGAYGVKSDTSIEVTNLGTIRTRLDAIHSSSGGSVVNGDYAHLGATIAGRKIALGPAAATISNFGTITAFVDLYDGGTVTNGGSGDTTALMNGGYGISLFGSGGTVNNFGTIEAHDPARLGRLYVTTGSVTNGGAHDTAAVIESDYGVFFGGAGTVVNFGAIRGPYAYAYGVRLGGGGRVTNGSVRDTAALIAGARDGVVLGQTGTVTNFGVIQGASESGVYLNSGGSVINGGRRDHSALITGRYGVRGTGGAATVKNSGTIQATGVGVFLTAGGVVTNGSPDNDTAKIEGYAGLGLNGPATATNFGTILGTGGVGAFLGGPVTLTNGAAGHATALIKGSEGIDVTGSGSTVANFGTICGTGGTAVSFSMSTDVLIVEAGSAFVGAVIGGGGTLKLDTGVGKLAGLFGPGGSVTVSGSMAATTFDDFATLRIGQAAVFTASGNVNLTAGEAIFNSGSLTLGGGKASVTSAGLIEADRGTLAIAGPVKNTGTLAAAGGTLAVTGAVTGSGSATIAGGALDFEGPFTEDVTFTAKTGVLELGKSQGYTGTVIGFSKSGGTSFDLDDIAFGKATKVTYAGTKSGGVLTVTDGVHTAHIALLGDYRNSTFAVASDGGGGTKVHDPASFIAAMAGFGADRGALSYPALEPWRSARPTLGTPRTHLA